MGSDPIVREETKMKMIMSVVLSMVAFAAVAQGE